MGDMQTLYFKRILRIAVALVLVLSASYSRCECATRASSEDDIREIEKTVLGYMQLEFSGGGTRREEHASFNSDVYKKYHAEPIVVYDDIALIDWYRVVEIRQEANVDCYAATIEFELLAILEFKRNDNKAASFYLGYSPAPYINASGNSEDPRNEYAQAFQFGLSKLFEPKRRVYHISLNLKKMGDSWLIVNGMKWREMSNASYSKLNEEKAMLEARKIRQREEIASLKGRLRHTTSPSEIKAIENEVVFEERSAGWLDAAISRNAMLLNLHRTIQQRKP